MKINKEKGVNKNKKRAGGEGEGDQSGSEDSEAHVDCRQHHVLTCHMPALPLPLFICLHFIHSFLLLPFSSLSLASHPSLSLSQNSLSHTTYTKEKKEKKTTPPGPNYTNKTSQANHQSK